MIRCAHIAEDGTYLGMVEIEPQKATALHLTRVGACDLPPGKYKWVADAKNPFGGAFWPIRWVKTAQQPARSSRPRKILARDILARDIGK